MLPLPKEVWLFAQFLLQWEGQPAGPEICCGVAKGDVIHSNAKVDGHSSEWIEERSLQPGEKDPRPCHSNTFKA